MSSFDAALYLENGELFLGKGFGYPQEMGGEVVFNTAMFGYQEVFSDPSYANQIVILGGTQIGNTGVNLEDNEGDALLLKGVVVREYQEPSNWRSTQSLQDYLYKHKVMGISEIDTRQITKIIRDQGAQRGILFPVKKEMNVIEHGKKLLASVPAMEGQDLVSKVSCQKPYAFAKVSRTFAKGTAVVYDFGVKKNILREIHERGFDVTVVPYNATAQEVLSYHPKLVVLSNGPGDPKEVPGSVKEIQSLIGKVPIFAICMGHQLIARAFGMNTYKLKFGHHGVNHPVKDHLENKIIITSQNHGFAVEFKATGDLQLSHTSLNDNTVEGFYSLSNKILSVQFHPEASPGPKDGSNLFDQFLSRFLQ